MVEIVIIGQNEGEHIEAMYKSLHEYPYARFWVLDRCTDDSENRLIELGERYIKTPGNLMGRQTGFARNCGLSHCNNESDVLFLDGDRYPVSGTLSLLEKQGTDISLLLLERDFRDVFTEKYRSIYGGVNNLFYSPGIFLKRKAINKTLEFQNGELFSTEMQDDWGIEDTYLGDVCYHLRLTADFYKECRLHGEFSRKNLESLNVLEKRFRKRELLNVRWG